MRFRLEAAPGELLEKGTRLVEELAKALSSVQPDLALASGNKTGVGFILLINKRQFFTYIDQIFVFIHPPIKVAEFFYNSVLYLINRGHGLS